MKNGCEGEAVDRSIKQIRKVCVNANNDRSTHRPADRQKIKKNSRRERANHLLCRSGRDRKVVRGGGYCFHQGTPHVHGTRRPSCVWREEALPVTRRSTNSADIRTRNNHAYVNFNFHDITDTFTIFSNALEIEDGVRPLLTAGAAEKKEPVPRHDRINNLMERGNLILGRAMIRSHFATCRKYTRLADRAMGYAT